MGNDIQLHILFDNNQNSPFYDDMNIDAPLPKINSKVCELAQPDGLILYKPSIKPKKVEIDDLFRRADDVAVTYSTFCLLLFNRKVKRKKLFEYCFLCSPFMFANYLFDLCSFIKNNKSSELNFYERHLTLIVDVLRCFLEGKSPTEWDPFDQMRDADFINNYECQDSFPAQQDKMKKKLCIYDGKDFKIPDLIFRDTLGKRNIVENLTGILQVAKEENVDYKTKLRGYFESIEEMLEKIAGKQTLTGEDFLESMAKFKKQI